jgi:glutamyl-tRNA reductase
MEKPILSPYFSVDDIHKLREWNYERRKNMTHEEYQKDIKQGCKKFFERLENLKK